MNVKGIKKSIGILFMCQFVCVIHAQAQELFTLEKTLNGQYSVQVIQYDDEDNFEDQLPYVTLSTPQCDMGYYYYTNCSGKSFTINLVSPDYVETKKTYTFEIPEDCTLQTCYSTRKLTGDKSLVFFVTYYATSKNGTMYSCGLFNCDGKLIQQFAEGVRYVTVYPMLYRMNNTYKLIVWRGNYNDSGYTLEYQTDIYTLKQSNSTKVKALQKTTLVPYPVPSSTIVNIPFSNVPSNSQLFIYDSNGMLVDSQILKGESGTAFINVVKYRPGIYMYKIGEQSGRFVVN